MSRRGHWSPRSLIIKGFPHRSFLLSLEDDLFEQRCARSARSRRWVPRLRPALRFHPHHSGDGLRNTAQRPPKSLRPSDRVRSPAASIPSAAWARPASRICCRTASGCRFTSAKMPSRERDYQLFRAARSRRHHRRRGLPVPHPHRRIEHPRREARVSFEDAARHAREVARPGRRGDPLPPALSGSDRQSRSAQSFRHARQDHRLAAPAAGSARLHRSGNAHDAAALRRRGGAAVRHASQHARYRSLPAHRAGAVSEAAGGGRPGARLRNQSQFPQRRHLHASQPRVHHAGVLPGLHRLSRPDGLHRASCCSRPRIDATGSARWWNTRARKLDFGNLRAHHARSRDRILGRRRQARLDNVAIPNGCAPLRQGNAGEALANIFERTPNTS